MRAVRPVVLLALMLAATLAAGCAEPAGTRVREIEVATPADPGCEAPHGACGYEWWNITLRGADLYSVTPPVPAPYPSPGGSMEDVAAAWMQNLTVTGAGRARVTHSHPDATAPDVLLSHVGGDGDFQVRSFVVREAEPEAFLRARWGPAANQTHPDAIPVHVYGSLDRLEITYEAHSPWCRREARYVLEGPLTMDRSIWVPGVDEVVACR